MPFCSYFSELVDVRVDVKFFVERWSCQFLYLTYLDSAASVGNAYVAGWTTNPNFPSVGGGSLGTPPTGSQDQRSFVTKLSPDGIVLSSVLIGGSCLQWRWVSRSRRKTRSWSADWPSPAVFCPPREPTACPTPTDAAAGTGLPNHAGCVSDHVRARLRTPVGMIAWAKQ